MVGKRENKGLYDLLFIYLFICLLHDLLTYSLIHSFITIHVLRHDPYVSDNQSAVDKTEAKRAIRVIETLFKVIADK